MVNKSAKCGSFYASSQSDERMNESISFIYDLLVLQERR